MKIHEIYCKRWILGKFTAITLYPFIFYRGIPTPATRRHEWTHVAQVRKMGWFGFYLKWLFLHFRYGYWGNPLEEEARAAEIK